MSKIIFIASGNNIAKYVHQLQSELENQQKLEIVNTQMEDALTYVKNQLKEDVDVIIARGNTARMLKEAKLPFPIVSMPIMDFEIINTIKKAYEKSNKTSPLIGYIGIQDVITNIQYFLKVLNLKVRLYKVRNTEDIKNSILQAQNEQVDVLIGGIYTCQLMDKMGVDLDYILLESSYQSVKEAYNSALEVQRSVNIQKKKLQEKNTILDSVSDAIISISKSGKVTSMNKVAEEHFNMYQSDVIGRSFTSIFEPKERTLIQQVLSTREKILGQVMKLNDKQYALTINPIVVSKRSTGAIISLHEINSIQKIESSLRKKLYDIDNITLLSFDNIKGNSFELIKIVELSKIAASLDTNMLIIGEPGSGKELFAQCIHNYSERKERPFVIADCNTFREDTIEKSLLGYLNENTSEQESIAGLFELAHGGTLYLSNISNLSVLGQSILLRIIKENQVQPVGLQKVTPVNVRIIASCSENLYDKMKQGLFRNDLYYELNNILLPVPALRQRKGDITYLTKYFFNYFNNKFQKYLTLSQATLDFLETLSWEGNVRQLKNFCQKLVALSKETTEIDLKFLKEQLDDASYFEHLGKIESTKPLPIEEKAISGFVINGRRVTKEDLKQLESFYGGNRTLMAKSLGISRSTLWKYMKKIHE